MPKSRRPHANALDIRLQRLADAKIFRVIVPVANPKPRRAKFLAYPCTGCPLYTAQEAVAVMESFGCKCPARIEEGHRLEVWAESEHCRFTLQMWLTDFNGVRTDNELQATA